MCQRKTRRKTCGQALGKTSRALVGVITLAATVKEFRSSNWNQSLLQKYEDNWIFTALQKVIADKVKQQVTNTLSALPELLREAIAQFIRASTLRVLCGIYTVLHPSKEHSILDRIWTDVPGETINKCVDKYLQAAKGAKSLGKVCSVMTTSLTWLPRSSKWNQWTLLPTSVGPTYSKLRPSRLVPPITQLWQQRPPCARSTGSFEFWKLQWGERPSGQVTPDPAPNSQS